MDWASKRERPTVIVFFGDHLPPLNQGYTETGFLKEPVPERREPPEALALHRETPLVIWSNKNGPMKDVGTISPSLIPLKLFQAAGIKHPYYTGFLGRVDAGYDVIDRHLLISHAGPTSDWSQQKKIDPLINDFRLLQYDAMFGRQRTVKRFFPNLPRAGWRVRSPGRPEGGALVAAKAGPWQAGQRLYSFLRENRLVMQP